MNLLTNINTYRLRNTITRQFKSRKIKKERLRYDLFNGIKMRLGNYISDHVMVVDERIEGWEENFISKITDPSTLYSILYELYDSMYGGLSFYRPSHMGVLIVSDVNEINDVIISVKSLYERYVFETMTESLDKMCEQLIVHAMRSPTSSASLSKLRSIVENSIRHDTTIPDHCLVPTLVNAYKQHGDSRNKKNESDLVEPVLVYLFASGKLKNIVNELKSEGFNNIRNEFVDCFIHHIKDHFFAHGMCVDSCGHHVTDITYVSPMHKERVLSKIISRDVKTYQDYRSFVSNIQFDKLDHSPQRVINLVKLKRGFDDGN